MPSAGCKSWVGPSWVCCGDGMWSVIPVPSAGCKSWVGPRCVCCGSGMRSVPSGWVLAVASSQALPDPLPNKK